MECTTIPQCHLGLWSNIINQNSNPILHDMDVNNGRGLKYSDCEHLYKSTSLLDY